MHSRMHFEINVALKKKKNFDNVRKVPLGIRFFKVISLDCAHIHPYLLNLLVGFVSSKDHYGVDVLSL